MAPKEIHAILTETLNCFLPGRAKGLSATLYIPSIGLTTALAKINLLTPNVNYSGRTALLTSKIAFYIFIQQK